MNLPSPLIPQTADTDDAFLTAALSYLAGELDASEVAALEAQLKESAHHRRLFTALATQSRLFHELHREPADAKPQPSVAVPTTGPVSAAGVPMYRKGCEPQPFKFRPRHYALLAATLLAACGLATYLLTASVDPEPSPAEPASPPAVATLIQNTGNLRTPHGYPAEGDDYGRGEYTLSSGTAEFMLTNAVNVKLRGSTRMAMRNDMNVALTHGSAAFVVPKDATGFTVHLPNGSRVVDLGTAFSVSIDEAGESIVRVTEGLVDVVTGPNDAQLQRALFAGSAGRISADGVYTPIAPAVRYAGSHQSTGGALRNLDLDKPLDPDPRPGGDNAYGSDGYVFWGVTPLGQSKSPKQAKGRLPVDANRLRDLPPYIAAVTEAPGTTVARDYGYLPIDDPAAAPSASPERLESGVIASPRDRNRQPTLMLTIRIGSDPPAQGVRLGLLVDNQTGKPLTPQLIRIESQHDHAETPSIAAASLGDGDAYFFDVSSLSEGDELRVIFTPRDPVRPATLVGLTFDPLPAPAPTPDDASSGENRPDALAPKPATDPEELQTTGPEKTLRKVRSERDEN